MIIIFKQYIFRSQKHHRDKNHQSKPSDNNITITKNKNKTYRTVVFNNNYLFFKLIKIIVIGFD